MPRDDVARSPRSYPCGVPALYAWLRRHPRLVDGVLAFALAFGGLGTAIAMHRYWLVPGSVPPTGALRFPRPPPVAAFPVVLAVGALQVICGIRPSPPDLSIVVMLYTLAAYTSRRASVTGLGICLLGSAAQIGRMYTQATFNRTQDWLLPGAIIFAGPTLLAWALG